MGYLLYIDRLKFKNWESKKMKRITKPNILYAMKT